MAPAVMVVAKGLDHVVIAGPEAGRGGEEAVAERDIVLVPGLPDAGDTSGQIASGTQLAVLVVETSLHTHTHFSTTTSVVQYLRTSVV